jgi:hypothetical protein
MAAKFCRGPPPSPFSLPTLASAELGRLPPSMQRPCASNGAPSRCLRHFHIGCMQSSGGCLRPWNARVLPAELHPVIYVVLPVCVC